MNPHFYQCSRHTTSVEVETVFQRAVKRQAFFDELQIPINCGKEHRYKVQCVIICIHHTGVGIGQDMHCIFNPCFWFIVVIHHLISFDTISLHVNFLKWCLWTRQDYLKRAMNL